ncbi:uncharacterized protein BKA78DRAFT_64241 [Phyllosticta capitalensis]|uniref:uncharacterized protein n=1 Tax=Phyllosticta capitalensis TaxID=121624 RepID=UPI0031311900
MKTGAVRLRRDGERREEEKKMCRMKNNCSLDNILLVAVCICECLVSWKSSSSRPPHLPSLPGRPFGRLHGRTYPCYPTFLPGPDLTACGRLDCPSTALSLPFHSHPPSSSFTIFIHPTAFAAPHHITLQRSHLHHVPALLHLHLAAPAPLHAPRCATSPCLAYRAHLHEHSPEDDDPGKLRRPRSYTPLSAARSPQPPSPLLVRAFPAETRAPLVTYHRPPSHAAAAATAAAARPP